MGLAQPPGARLPPRAVPSLMPLATLVAQLQLLQWLQASSRGLVAQCTFCQHHHPALKFPSGHTPSPLACLGPMNTTGSKHSPQQVVSVQMMVLKGKVTQTQHPQDIVLNDRFW